MLTELQNNLNTIHSEIMEKLIPENIKKDVTILNVTGALEQGGLDTSDATATSDDIISPKTAYVNNEKITGAIIERNDTLLDVINIGKLDNVADISFQNNLVCTYINNEIYFHKIVDNVIDPNSSMVHLITNYGISATGNFEFRFAAENYDNNNIYCIIKRENIVHLFSLDLTSLALTKIGTVTKGKGFGNIEKINGTNNQFFFGIAENWSSSTGVMNYYLANFIKITGTTIDTTEQRLNVPSGTGIGNLTASINTSSDGLLLANHIWLKDGGMYISMLFKRSNIQENFGTINIMQSNNHGRHFDILSNDLLLFENTVYHKDNLEQIIAGFPYKIEGGNQLRVISNTNLVILNEGYNYYVIQINGTDLTFTTLRTILGFESYGRIYQDLGQVAIKNSEQDYTKLSNSISNLHYMLRANIKYYDTSDAQLNPSDILKGKIAYDRTGKVVGTLVI